MAPDELSGWLEGAHDSFEKAIAAAGLVGHNVEVAGMSVRLRFAGPALEPAVMPAFAHLPPPSDGPPDLDVFLWDSGSTGMVPPWERLSGRHGILRPGDPDNAKAAPARAVYQPVEEAFSMVDGGRAMFWALDASLLPNWERAAPLRHVFSLALQSSGLHVVHAGAVGGEDGGVLLIGPGGSGKSTAALACLDSCLTYAGDDYVIVDPAGTPWVHSLYSSGKLELPQSRRFGHLDADHRPRQDEKALFFVHAQNPDRTTKGFPLRAVLIPCFGGHDSRHTSIEPISSKAEVLAALAPSTVFQLPAAGSSTLTALAKLVESLPAYRLRTGTDLSAIPSAIQAVLA